MVESKISALEVEDAVHRYWRVLMEKSSGEMANFYTYDAMVFSPFSPRPEPGRVSAARKEREYFTPGTTFRAEIVGPINVQLVDTKTAIATYQFRWRAQGMVEHLLGKKFDKALRDGRATQVFILAPDGSLKIVNEHLSDIWRDGTAQES